LTAPIAAAVAAADLNGDGRADLVVATLDSSIGVLLNVGNGAFGARTDYGSPDNGGSVAGIVVADFNSDGLPDVAVTAPLQSTVDVLANKGDGTFARPVTYATDQSPLSVAAADFDGDGRLDLAATSAEMNSVVVLRNTTPPDTVPPTLTTAPRFNFDAPKPSLTAAFSEPLAPADARRALSLTNTATGQSFDPATIAFTFDPATHVATWTFPGLPHGALPDGDYAATIAAPLIKDLAGNTLADGDLHLAFFSLAADANHDRVVDFNDLVKLAQNYNTVGGMTFAQGDFNYDGDVDFDDLVLLAQRYNAPLPAATLAAMTVARTTTTTAKPAIAPAKPARPPAPAATNKRPAAPAISPRPFSTKPIPPRRTPPAVLA
jgi:hypothetical protein